MNQSRHQVADPLLYAEEAGELLGLSAYTVRQWAREQRRRLLAQEQRSRGRG